VERQIATLRGTRALATGCFQHLDRENQLCTLKIKTAKMPSSGAYGFQMAKVAWELGSCFRRMVTDVIQVWLGVLNHPTQGLEQAEPIFRRALRPLFRSDFHAHRETQDGPNDRFAAIAAFRY
jgi:hypothetical protein